MIDQVKIGGFLRELRKEKELTQEQLAEKLHVSNKTVSKWETAKGLPDISLIPPLCSIFNVSADMLLGIDTESLPNYHYIDKSLFLRLHALLSQLNSHFHLHL